MEKLIATYKESRLELRRRFDLFPDHIRVFGSGLFHARSDISIPLTNLSTSRCRMWVRGRLYAIGLWILFFVALAVVPAAIVRGPLALGHPWFLGVFGPVVCAGLLLVAISIKPVEYATFQGNAGITVLDIGRVGPQAEEFEDFVALLIESIHTAQMKYSLVLPPASPEGRLKAFPLPPVRSHGEAIQRRQTEGRIDPTPDEGQLGGEDVGVSRQRTRTSPEECVSGEKPVAKEDLAAHPLRPFLAPVVRLFRAGDHRGTLDLLEPVIEHDEDANRPSPISGLLWAVAGDCYFLLDEPDKGFRAYRHAMELDGDVGCRALFACQVVSHQRVGYAEEALEVLRADRASLWRVFRKHPIHLVWHSLNWEFLYLLFFRLPIVRWRLRRMAVQAKG